MTRAERAVRSALNYYRPSLRAGHWAAAGSGTGSDHLPKRGFLRAAFADIDTNGLVYDIRLYAYGEIMLRSDGAVNDETRYTIDITDEVETYIKGYGTLRYDYLVYAIMQKAAQKMSDNLYIESDIDTISEIVKKGE